MAKKEQIQSAAFKRNTLTVVAVILFGMIVLSEIALAISIPWYLQRENTMAEEVLRLSLRSTYDSARGVSGSRKGRDEVRLAELSLTRWALDSMADYLREYASRLNKEELKNIQTVVSGLDKIARRLQESSYSREQRLDTAFYINSLIPEESSHEKK